MRLSDTLNKKRNVPGLEAFADDVDDEPNPKEGIQHFGENLKNSNF